MKIQNNVLVMLMFVFFVPAMQAQKGIRVGVNLANQTVEFSGQSLDTKMKFGSGLGVFYQYNINDNFSVQAESNFMQMGSKSEGEESGIKYTGKSLFYYSHMPILAKYGFGDMDSLNFYVQGGPYLGLGLGIIKKKSCVGDNCVVTKQEYGDGEDGPKSLDFGVQFGAGVNINQYISFDARYILGVSNLSTVENSTLKNNAIFVSVGYKF